MRTGASFLLSLLTAAVAASCSDCERDGCAGLTQSANRGANGVAGVVASESDLVTDGCMECPFGDATLQIWRIDAALATTADAQAIVNARQPEVTTAVSGRYRYELAPGRYLLCVRPSCIDVDVAAGATTTVNIKRREGPIAFFVAAAGAVVTERGGFDVGF